MIEELSDTSQDFSETSRGLFTLQDNERRYYELKIRKLLFEYETLKKQNDVLKNNYVSDKTNVVNQMLAFVKSESQKINEIKAIYFSNRNTCKFVFIIEPFNKDTNDSVFSLEYVLLGKYNNLQFDILVLPKIDKQELPTDMIKLM